MTVIVAVFETAGLTVSEKKTETMLLWTRNQAPRTSPLVIEAIGQRYRQATQFLYLGGLVMPAPKLCQISNDGFDSHGHATKRFKRELHDMEAAPFTLKVRMLQAEVMGDPAVRVCNVGPRQVTLR